MCDIRRERETSTRERGHVSRDVNLLICRRDTKARGLPQMCHIQILLSFSTSIGDHGETLALTVVFLLSFPRALIIN